jgi:hypothetical protein
MGILTAQEVEKTRAISQKRYGSALIVSQTSILRR